MAAGPAKPGAEASRESAPASRARCPFFAGVVGPVKRPARGTPTSPLLWTTTSKTKAVVSPLRDSRACACREAACNRLSSSAQQRNLSAPERPGEAGDRLVQRPQRPHPRVALACIPKCTAVSGSCVDTDPVCVDPGSRVAVVPQSLCCIAQALCQAWLSLFRGAWGPGARARGRRTFKGTVRCASTHSAAAGDFARGLQRGRRGQAAEAQQRRGSVATSKLARSGGHQHTGVRESWTPS